MGILSKIAKGAAGIFVKKVTTVAPDGDEVSKIRPREAVKGLGWITGFLIVWHFILQPVLSHHFPQYQFPALDFSWVSGLLLGL